MNTFAGFCHLSTLWMLNILPDGYFIHIIFYTFLYFIIVGSIHAIWIKVSWVFDGFVIFSLFSLSISSNYFFFRFFPLNFFLSFSSPFRTFFVHDQNFLSFLTTKFGKLSKICKGGGHVESERTRYNFISVLPIFIRNLFLFNLCIFMFFFSYKPRRAQGYIITKIEKF